MDVMVDKYLACFVTSLLHQYRTFTHDAILIYGFIPDNASTGAIKALFTIEDGLR